MPAVSLQPDNVAMFSRKELADRWGVSTDTIRRLEQDGLLNPIRFNSRLLRYRRQDVEAIERRLLGTEKVETEREFPAPAVWSNQHHDKPVVITGVAGTDEASGEKYFVTESGTGVPESELVFDT